MPTLLMGHGQVLPDEPVKLPEGWSISFLIDAARVMPFSNGVGVVMNIGSLQQEGFTLSSFHDGGEEISNHLLGVLTNNQRAWYAQVDPEDGSCYYAGDHFTDGLRLCEDPGPDGQCAQNPRGVHTCGGLLSLAWPDPNLVWVSCRQDPNPASFSANKPQMFFGEGAESAHPKDEPTSEFVDFANAAEKQLKDDPDGFATWFDGLTDEQIAQLMYKLPIRKWSFQRQAREWLKGGATEEQFFAFVEGQDEVDHGLYLKDAPDLAQAHERGKFVRHARDYLEAQGPQNFLLYANGLDKDARAVLEAYPDLAQALGGTGDATSAEAQSQRFGITVDEIDWSMVQGVSEKAIKDAPDGGQVPFWQLPTGQVLIGGPLQPETYRKLIELVRDGEPNPTGNAPNGTIKVTKGGLTSKGKLEVAGATDEDTMTSWIGSFSDKKIVFA
jgi:hypothetical protein